MILIDRYVKFLIDNQLSERQFLGLYLSYTKRNDLIELFKKKVTNGMKIINSSDIPVIEAINANNIMVIKINFLPNGFTFDTMLSNSFL